jgi:hypothetical protein
MTSGLPQSIAKTTNSKGFVQLLKVISESVPFNIVAYPNPSTSYFAQLLMEEVMKVTVKVYDVLGRLINNIQSTDGQNITLVQTT